MVKKSTYVILEISSNICNDKSMHAECPLCGRLLEWGVWESYHATDIAQTERQIANLEQLLSDLQNDREQVTLLLEERFEACPLCEDMLKGISSDAGKKVLEERLALALVELERREDQFEFTGA